MMGRTHILVGVTTGLSVSAITDEPIAMSGALVAGAFIGSLLPDADHKDALVYRKLRCRLRHPLPYLLVSALYLLISALRLPLRLVSLLPHRGVATHGPFVGGLIVPALATMVVIYAANAIVTMALVGAVLGYWLHLGCDSLTIRGLPGWPVRERIHLLPRGYRLTTGSIAEKVFVCLLFVIIVIVVYVLAYRWAYLLPR
jgi:membrane-bound metal-dependent hydrolase YbcI (DUF457 family)